MNAAEKSKTSGLTPLSDVLPPLTKLSRPLQEVILLMMKYVAQATGAEPCQEEIATILKSYFTLDEVTNQIKYLHKKIPVSESPGADPDFRPTPMRINLMLAQNKNSLARAGFFIRPIVEAVAGIRRHAKSVLGIVPSDTDIALSLKSSFILSELKNQIVHIRQKPPKRGR